MIALTFDIVRSAVRTSGQDMNVAHINIYIRIHPRLHREKFIVTKKGIKRGLVGFLKRINVKLFKNNALKLLFKSFGKKLFFSSMLLASDARTSWEF